MACFLCLFAVLAEFLYVIAALNLAYPISPWKFKLFCGPPNTTDDSFLSPAGAPNNASALKGASEAIVEAKFNSSGIYVPELSKTVFHCCFGNEQGQNCSALTDNTEGKTLASVVKASVFRQLGKYFYAPSIYSVVFCLHSVICFNSVKLLWIRCLFM